MVTLIIGKKGSGKTKKLISLANEAVSASNGNVVVVERVQSLLMMLLIRQDLLTQTNMLSQVMTHSLVFLAVSVQVTTM